MSRRCLFSTLALSLFLGNSNALAMESFDLHNIDKVQQQGWTGNGVYVGVVDVNVQTDHPLLADNIAKVYSSTTWQPDKYPAYSFHGTHVAGILAATSTNGKSYGIATDAKLLINYMYANSKNTIFDEFPIKIINNSHTQGYGYFANYARKDVLNVFSSGNYGQMSPQANTMKGIGSNSNLGAWIIVGNLNRGGASRNANGKLVLTAGALNNQGNWCGGALASCVMASGSNIYSLGKNSGMATAGGTSMAAPLVSGVAALVAQKYPFLGGKQLADVILSTANKDYEFPKVFIKGKNIIYVDHTKPTTEEEIRKDLTAAYNEKVGKDAKIEADLSNVLQKSREDIFGQGIVDAESAMKGLKTIDINRMSVSDVQTIDGVNVAMWTLNTQGYNPLFEHDIDQKKWNDKYHVNNKNAATLKATLGNVNAGLKKTGLGTLSLSGDLNYKGPTIVEEGTLELGKKVKVAARSARLFRANSTSATVQGDMNVEQRGTLNINHDANLKQNLNNSGTTNIDAATNVAQDVNNQGTLNLGISKPQTLTVGGKYSQGNGATLQLAFLVDDSTNSKLTATNYDISGGSLVYAPLSASVLDRSIAFDLGDLSQHLNKFNTISLNSNGYALSYSLTSGRNGITITARPNVYADFSGANPSLASVLRLMSSANISNDYNTFFSTLNAADFATYRSALVDLNDMSHLQYNNLLLGIQNQDILDKVINLQTEAEGVFLRPRYAHLKAGLKANRAGFEFYANKNTSIGGFSSFINYDNLSGSDVSSQLVSLGLALRNTTALPIGIFGGARLGFANNTVKKTQSLQYKTQSASLFAGVDKDFEFAGEVHFIPTFYVNYHYFHQENFHHAGISYRGTAFFNRLQTNGFNGNNLFARNIHAKNTNFASANLGLTFKQNLAQFWNLGIHGFYERRLLGDKFKTSAQLSDFGGDFEQTLQISQNFFRFGFNLNYELPMNAKGIGYFASVGVDYETSSNGIDRYRAYGADFKGGIKF